MSEIVLTRIDDRLIHGQVMTAWVGFTSIFWTHFLRVFFRNESTLENVIISVQYQMKNRI